MKDKNRVRLIQIAQALFDTAGFADRSGNEINANWIKKVANDIDLIAADEYEANSGGGYQQELSEKGA